MCVCAAEDVKIRQAAWECLVRVATCYYEKLPPYMQDIFVLSQRAVKQDDEAVALQAIEFWCTICEEELDKASGSEQLWLGSSVLLGQQNPELVLQLVMQSSCQ